MQIPPVQGVFQPRPVRVSQLPHYQQRHHLKGSLGHRFPRVHSTRLLWNAFKETFYDFTSVSKIHGSHYLQRHVTRGPSRVLWVGIILSFFVFGVALIVLLWQKFLDNPTRVTIASDMKLVEVPFPGVTLCHPQSVVEYKAKRFVERM
ncbi:uncharacterized protein LOC128278806 [Anopheles cruzii]|uniref:uncharacterized protein LOC128278806 n=1 Tax=Anopheles cruzii TaxID=68878 RepID=UPI0022EC4DF2|nr:uncharacterized protein LOC128278806 [Anopheles cruzii]